MILSILETSTAIATAIAVASKSSVPPFQLHLPGHRPHIQNAPTSTSAEAQPITGYLYPLAPFQLATFTLRAPSPNSVRHPIWIGTSDTLTPVSYKATYSLHTHPHAGICKRTCSHTKQPRYCDRKRPRHPESVGKIARNAPNSSKI